ncbi:MAG: hypothetical protein J2P37_15350 [Ktedonobacteraceae bacterium]|nr:hypothetical protein [Ktedonobacteraceae bacterium]
MLHKIIAILSRKMIIALVCLLLVGGFAASAFAYTQTNSADAAATTCFGQKFDMGSHTVSSSHAIILPERHSQAFTTSSHCRDINVRITQFTHLVHMRVCFHQPGNPISACSASKTIWRANQWYVLATNVRDGVKYTIDVTTYGNVKFSGFIAD